jgi:DNA-binding transcriptional MocR family regulator
LTLGISIDRASSTPVYAQIQRRFAELIRSGRLPQGTLLPPERRLAQELGLNRSTVLAAYRGLKAEGLVDAHVGRGTVVLPLVNGAGGRGPAWSQLAREATAAPDPLLRDLLETTERQDGVSLAVGLPAAELLPLETFRSVHDRLLSDHGASLLLHSPTEGVSSFRDAVAAYLRARGVRAGAGEVLVTSGSQQGLHLMARVFLDPGDAVVVEEPTYLGALEAFRHARARLLSVPTDGDGLRTDLLESLLARVRPKLIYVLPTFQNPSGRVLSPERRRHLLALARRHDVPILEDDPYWELRYEGESVPPVKSLDAEGHVVYLSSFSKILFPGLRVGFLVAPRNALRLLALAKQGVDLHTNTLGQRLVERFLVEGHLAAHLERCRREYAQRRDAMLDGLAALGRTGVTASRPAGGFYVWCRLPEDVPAGRLAADAAREGVSYLPGEACSADGAGESHLRLNFTSQPPERIREGLARLGRALGAAATRVRDTVLSAGTRPIV